MRTLASKALGALVLALTLAGAVPTAMAQPDRSSFGDDIVVRRGETVGDVVTMGGDARIDGVVTGDVSTMGGDVDVREGAVVDGDVESMGGDLRVHDGATVGGDMSTLGGDIDLDEGAIVRGSVTQNQGGFELPTLPAIPSAPHAGHGIHAGSVLADVLGGLVSYTLLFLLGLLLMGVFPERFEAMQVAIVRQPLRAGGYGVLGAIGGVVAIVVLAITIIGIPAAVLLAVAFPFAIYVGMTAFATVFGTLLPVEALRGKPVLRLGAGVLALYVASLVPFAGSIAVAAAAVVGLGALVITRFKTTVEVERERAASDGPYRAPAM